MMLDEPVTANFHLSEFVVSDTAARLGIDNTPPASVLATLRNVLIPAMQAVRALLGVPIIIKSGYRSPELNNAIRGSQNSQHVDGHACDWVAPGFGPPSAICRELVEHLAELRLDQLIYEGGWVHSSFSPHPRYEVLTAHFAGGGVTYTRGLA